jgi:hypothetical protein
MDIPARSDERYGAQGAFLIEAGISSSYHIANFFGLTEWIRQPKEVTKEVAKVTSTRDSKEAARMIPEVAPVSAGAPDLNAVLWPLTTLRPHPKPPTQPKRGAIDVSGVITRALTAAGLMK